MAMVSEGYSDSPRGIAMGVPKICFLILVLSGYYVSAASRLNCTFDDNNLCSWIQDTTTLSWKFGSGISTNSTGPKQPVGRKGRYIYVSSYEGTQSDNEKIARLQSAVFTSFYPDAGCFSFYYHMFGVHVGELRVILVPMQDEKTPLGRQVIWRRRGTQPDKWLQLKDSLNVTEGHYRIDIEAEGGSGFVGDIAIDEITMKSGACSGVELCDFESSLCGWTIEGSSQGRYSWRRGVKLPKGPSQDHTTMTEVGYYLQAVARDGAQTGERTSLVSPELDEGLGPHCLTFWYYRPGFSTGKISVLKRRNDKETLQWSATRDVGKSWHYGQITIDEKTSLRIVFQAEKGPRNENEMAIDDIEIKNGACGQIAECNFNTNYCSYFLNETSDFAWLLGTGRVVNTQFVDKIPADNSVENGMFIYADMTPPSLKEGQQAVLVSEILEVPVGRISCLIFYYHSDGRDSAILSVGKRILDNTNKDLKYNVQEVYRSTYKTGSGWTEKFLIFAGNLGTLYQLYFRATKGSGPRAFIAVDDISLIAGPCEDYCSSNPCLNDGSCINIGNSFKCVCQKPFFGDKCEEDPCTSNPCLNAGVCSINGNSFKCACWTPFFGDKCEEDPCSSNPCLNDGDCSVNGTSFKCSCRRPFFGDRCEEGMCYN
ncbi:MAM and LDL-receptor class A domain-containing protein 1 [Araneus ventricosus]|uniref:MAM and LDL-receptor class A domain-containing protein 1 n=1 Tax=Araneus ventricosus TaxID=182803 RepID=A0A4Y2ILC5_ARAVE|nr:MAM and LDL-receptor class A domain-containing protein 1 [Araneus ventricosus]